MSLRKQLAVFGIAAAALVGTATAALAVPAVATGNVNVRTGPGTGYGIVDTLRRGERVDIDYCQGSWCYVNKSGPDGWVSSSYLSRGGSYRAPSYQRPPVVVRPPVYRPGRPVYRDRDYRPYRPYRPNRGYYRPAPGFCVGGPNASFCVNR